MCISDNFFQFFPEISIYIYLCKILNYIYFVIILFIYSFWDKKRRGISGRRLENHFVGCDPDHHSSAPPAAAAAAASRGAAGRVPARPRWKTAAAAAAASAAGP